MNRLQRLLAEAKRVEQLPRTRANQEYLDRMQDEIETLGEHEAADRWDHLPARGFDDYRDII